MKNFNGIIPALLTPYDRDNRVNINSLENLVYYLLEKGISGFYVGGSTGEAFLLSLDERKKVLETVIKANQGCGSVIAHVGCVSTQDSIELSQHAADCGADAVSAVAPFYYSFNKKEVAAHYLAIAEATPLPMIIYNFPAFSGVRFTLDDFSHFYTNEKIIGVKYTDKDLFLMERIKSLDPNRCVLFGVDEMTVSGIAAGAEGSIGSTFNLMPEVYGNIYKMMKSNQITGARKLQTSVNMVIEVLIKYGVFASLKYAIERQYNIPMGAVRAPFVQLSDAAKKSIDATLDVFFNM